MKSQGHLLQPDLRVPNRSLKTTLCKVATRRRGVRINMDQTPSRQEAERAGREQTEQKGARREQGRAGREQGRAEGEQRGLSGEQSGGRRQARDHVGNPTSATFYLNTYLLQ